MAKARLVILIAVPKYWAMVITRIDELFDIYIPSTLRTDALLIDSRRATSEFETPCVDSSRTAFCLAVGSRSCNAERIHPPAPLAKTFRVCGFGNARYGRFEDQFTRAKPKDCGQRNRCS